MTGKHSNQTPIYIYIYISIDDYLNMDTENGTANNKF